MRNEIFAERSGDGLMVSCAFNPLARLVGSSLILAGASQNVSNQTMGRTMGKRKLWPERP